MTKKQIFTLEYEVSCSPGILFEFVSTAEGFREWFADRVVQKGDLFTFFWNESSEQARLIELETNKKAKFKWVEDGVNNYFFEFTIDKTEISNQTIFSITDFALPNEIEDQKKLWKHQVNDLFHRIGV